MPTASGSSYLCLPWLASLDITSSPLSGRGRGTRGRASLAQCLHASYDQSKEVARGRDELGGTRSRADPLQKHRVLKSETLRGLQGFIGEVG